MKIIILFKVSILISLRYNDARIIQDEDDDHIGNLGPEHNQGAPLYFDTAGGHQREYDEYPGYDGYANYAPHHDHEHYAYPRYKFEYGVHDPHTGDIKKQYEERDGDTVRGYYSLVEPDGSIRIVEYTADAKHGFQATVRKIGPQNHPIPTSSPEYHSRPETNYHHGYPNYPSHRYPSHRDPLSIHKDHSHEQDNHRPPALYPLHSSGEHGYGHNVYEPGQYSNPLHQYGPGGHVYEDNVDDYPYHSNINYPVYILPQNGHSAVQDVLRYDGPHFIENADKYFHKRSPTKKTVAEQANNKRTPKSKGFDGESKRTVKGTKTENVKLAAASTTVTNSTRIDKPSNTTAATNSTTVKSEIKLTSTSSPLTR